MLKFLKHIFVKPSEEREYPVNPNAVPNQYIDEYLENLDKKGKRH